MVMPFKSTGTNAGLGATMVPGIGRLRIVWAKALRGGIIEVNKNAKAMKAEAAL